MASIHDVSERLADRLRAHVEKVHPDHRELLERLAGSPVITDVAMHVVEIMGLGVDNHGEIYDPAPPPRETGVAQVRQTGAHWSGGRRNRGRYRR